MKPFKEYLSEGVKKYDFRVKIAGDANKDLETKLESLLDKFKVSSFKKLTTTPVQSLPLDFPKLSNEQVHIYEVVLDYPTTQDELRNYIGAGLKIARENLAVRRPGEPLEEYQDSSSGRKGEDTLLTDPDYKESPNAKFEDYYGDQYNQSFLKELGDVLKLQRHARGEVIPNKADDVTKADGKTLNDIPQNNTSPIQQATKYDPRK